MQQITNYMLAITPAFLVFAALLLVVPQTLSLLRIVLHMLFFVLARDAMTPHGFWQVGPGSLRFTAPEISLLFLGIASVALAAGTYCLERASHEGVKKWAGRRVHVSIALGLLGAFLISFIAWILKRAFNAPSMPAVETGLLPTILVFALAGNLYEEMLFRGLLQGHLQKHMTAIRAALVSGLLFSLCHSFLATTVTQVGVPILAFTLVEGIIAGLVCIHGGVLGATVAHGMAIFILAAGLY